VITIHAKPSLLRFAGRKQWKFSSVAGNGKRADPRDTYSNVGDIRGIMTELVDGGQPVELAIHYPGRIVRERLR
jgi:hypothetical protein